MNHIKQLELFGLSENQSKIYFALLEFKKATVLQLARKIGIQRPTIYDNISILQDMGLVSRVVEEGKPFFAAEDPEHLHQYLARKQKEAGLLVPELQEVFGQSSVFPEIKLFRGSEGLKRLAEIIPYSKEKAIRTIGSYEENIRGMFHDRFLQELWKSRARKSIQARVLFAHHDLKALKATKAYSEVGNIRYNREVRILPESIRLHVLYTIVDDQVLFWSNRKEGYSFLFRSGSYAESLKTMFDFLWSVAIPIEKFRNV